MNTPISLADRDLRQRDLVPPDRLTGGGRLLSAYTIGHGVRFWVITESDRSSTCVLLPEEY